MTSQEKHFDRLAEVAKDIFGTILTVDGESVLYHQAMCRRYAVQWDDNQGMYVIKNPSSGNDLATIETAEDVVQFMGGKPPYEYVRMGWWNGNIYSRIYHN